MRRQRSLGLVVFLVFAAAALGFFNARDGSALTPATTTPGDLTTENSPLPTSTVEWEFNVPILMYHYIRDYNDPQDQVGINLSISPEKLAGELDYFALNGYTTITFSELASGTLPKKPIILTFDDGYSDAYAAAYPALRQRGMKGVFFVVTGFVGKPGYLTWENVQALSAAGMEIGSHTLNHLDLTKLSAAELQAQLKESKSILQEKRGEGKVMTLSYPAGKYNDTVVAAAAAAGYDWAVTTKPGVATSAQPPLELTRIRVQNETNLTKILP